MENKRSKTILVAVDVAVITFGVVSVHIRQQKLDVPFNANPRLDLLGRCA